MFLLNTQQHRTSRFPSRKRLRWRLLLLLAAAFQPVSVGAQSYFSLVGEFDDPANEVEVDFRLVNDLGVSDVFDLRTYHYSGGTNHAGYPIFGSGFDPRVDLFDSTSLWIAGNDDIDGPGQLWDAQLDRSDLPQPSNPFPAGVYQAAMGVVGAIPAASGHWALDLSGPTGDIRIQEINADGTLHSLHFGTFDSVGSPSVVLDASQAPLTFRDGIHVGEFGWAQLTVDATELTMQSFISGFEGPGVTGITNGGEVRTTGIAAVAWLNGSDSSVVRVSDAGSLFEVGSTLHIGDEGQGTLHVDRGGRASVADDTYLGRFHANALGYLSIDGAGSRMEAMKDMYAGGNTVHRVGTAEISIGNGGRLSVGSPGRDGNLQVYAGSSVDVNSGGLLEADAVTLEPGSAFHTQPGSTVRVNNLNGFGDHAAFGGSLELGSKYGVHIGYHGLTRGQSLTVDEDFIVGEEIEGRLSVHDGGFVATGGNGYVGRRQDNVQLSRVQIDGANNTEESTVWHVSESLFVAGDDGSDGASAGSASVEATNGAWLVVDDTLHVWDNGRVSIDGSSQGVVGHSGYGIPGKLNVIGGGTLSGTGLIDADVQNSDGTIAPGSSPGRLDISGSFSQLPSGVLEIEIGGQQAGTQYDQIAVGGNAILDGLLVANLVDLNGSGRYTPSIGETFDILTIQGVYGQAFSHAILPVLPFGLDWSINYLANVVQLEVTSLLTFSADFDRDGQVDGDDFLIWQTNFNQFTGQATQDDGDANGDGVVDGDDFLEWQRQFGSSGGGNGAATAAVPEPAAMWILAAAAGTLLVRRSNRNGR